MPREPTIGHQDRVRRQSSVKLAAEARHVHWSVARIEARSGVRFPSLHARRHFANIARARRAGGHAAIRKRISKVFQSGSCVAPQWHLGWNAAADLFRDDIEMNDRDLGWR